VGERFINVATSYDSLSFGKLTGEKSLPPFEIKLDKFVGQYDPKTNAPKDYTAWVTITDKGTTYKKVLKVNQPLTFGNTRVYLQANGYSPVVTVRDSQGNVALQGPIPFLPQDGNLRSIGAIKVPDAEPQIGFVSSFVPTNARTTGQGAISIFPELLDPKLLFSIWKGDLGLDSGIPQSVYRIDTSKLEKVGLGSVKPGETFTYPEGSITLETVVPWINLQIVEDPGKRYALIGGIVAVLGLLSSLYGRRRRIWIRITSDRVEVAGLAKNSAPGLEVEMQNFVSAIRGDK
jgi:cytochrome c biogenesis protein